MLSAAPAEDIHFWVDADQNYDDGDLEEAIENFEKMAPSARVKFNEGCCYLALEDIEKATERFSECIEFDKHLAIAYFMLGLTHTVRDRHVQALVQFKLAQDLLRGNPFVDYRQLGFQYQLFASTILHNRAVNLHRLKHEHEAKEQLLEIIGNKSDPCYKAIKESIDRLQTGDQLDPIGPPRNKIFRPPKALVANIKGKDYLGKSKVISHSDVGDIYPCFSGLQLEGKCSEKNVRDDLLKDLRKPEIKTQLRSTIRRNEGASKKTRGGPPLKKLPTLTLEDVDQIFPPQKPLPMLQAVDGEEGSKTSTSPPDSRRSPLLMVPTQMDFIPHYADAVEVSKREKSKSIANLPNGKISIHDRPRSHSLGHMAKGFFKKPKSPVFGRRSKSPLSSPLTEDNPFIPVKSSKSASNINDTANSIIGTTSASAVPPKLSLIVPPPREEDLESSGGEEEEVCVFEVQYSFVKKVKLPRSAQQWQLKHAVQVVEVPDEIDLCYTDTLGRQLPLTTLTYSKLVNLPDVNRPRLLCFPKADDA